MASSVVKNSQFLTRLFVRQPNVFPQAFSNRLIHKTAGVGQVSASNIVTSNDHVDPITGVTIPEFIWSNLHKWEDAPAFECGVSGRKYTHGMINKLSRSFGAALKQHGLKRHDVVCLLLPNVPEYPIATLGAWEASLVVSPINPVYTPAEIAKQVNGSQSKVIIALSQFVPTVREVQKLSSSLKSIIVIGDAVDGCHSFSEMVKVNSQGVEFARGSQFDTTDELALLPYSSGTTGPPKGVMLSHSNIASNLFQMTRPGYVETNFFEKGDEQDRFIGILPFFHSFGFTVVMAKTLYQGAFTRTLPKFEPPTFIKALREHKPKCVHLVPPLIAFMANSPDVTKNEFVSIRAIMGGAAPIGEALITRLLEKAGKYFFFQEGYGMTEMSPVSHILPGYTKNTKIGSTGVILPGTQCKIVDPSTGAALGANQRGEICVKGPQNMKGYFKNDKATAETIDSEGWLHTGDIGLFDEGECFWIVDRMKELIKVKGLQVAPSELEDMLRTHPDVADVAVIGIPDERAGELPRAYIVRKKETLSENEVKEFIAEKVSDHKKLAGGVEFLPAIPKAASGKILRRELKALYLSKS
ncbi:4-coumarate--CoA ligase 2 [Orchesella cincta]|uniref:Luciferin 4-monooxygenase n=1 Tax=Orchesella cincta TaxID=48709 RepID=A0A1D2MZY4_ORCCI|nr:4-coumarate--CoA ligase 2 [Orchesella cincta]